MRQPPHSLQWYSASTHIPHSGRSTLPQWQLTRDKICTSVANRVIPGSLPALNLQSCTIQQCRDVSSAMCARLDQVKQDLPGVVNRLCAHDSENPQCTRAHAKTLRQLVRSMSSCCQESQVHTSLKQRIKKRDPWVNFKEEDCPQSRYKW